jgi:SAM-dependent methyltransferase
MRQRGIGVRLFRKLKLPGSLIRFAYHFVDVEASGEAAPPDGRIIEYSFVIGRLGQMKPGKVLDVGCTARLNFLPTALASLGWEVWGIDQREWKFKFPDFHFIQGDIRHTDLPEGFLDAVYALSTLEHIGLSGRYGITKNDPEGDFKAVSEIARILGKGGKFLVTIPYNKRYKVVKSQKRIYDEEGLQKLFSGWKIEGKILYAQDSGGFWTLVSEEQVQSMRENKEAIALLELALQSE